MKLKPCPFCGGEAQINERYRSGIPNRKMYWISCKACGISQQNTNVSGYRYQSKAIDRWNRREPMDEVMEQLDSLKEHELSMHDFSAVRGIKRAIEIVKSGGAE